MPGGAGASNLTALTRDLDDDKKKAEAMLRTTMRGYSGEGGELFGFPEEEAEPPSRDDERPPPIIAEIDQCSKGDDAPGISSVSNELSLTAVSADDEETIIVFAYCGELPAAPEQSVAPVAPTPSATRAVADSVAAVGAPSAVAASSITAAASVPSTSRPAFVEVRRLDLIRVVRGRIAAEAASGVPSFGSSSSALSAWDVHLLDPSSDSRASGFVLRRGCILLAMAPLRVVLTARAFFLVPEPGCDGALEPIMRLLGDADLLAASKVPLPVLALAAILDVCRRSMAADMRELSSTASQLSVKLRHRRGAEEVLLQRLAAVDSDLGEYLGRLRSVLGAVASFSDAEARHAAEASSQSRVILHDVHALVVDFGMGIEELDGEARDAVAAVAARKRALALVMSRHRMRILAVGLALQLVTCMFAFCSMVSGWFGMNLDNGICGPDGCNDYGRMLYQAALAIYNACIAAGDPTVCGSAPVDFDISDHGNKNFLTVVLCSTLAAVVAGALAWIYIRRLF